MQKMTALVAMKFLKGEQKRTLSAMEAQRVVDNRLLRANGQDTSTNDKTVEAAKARVKEAYQYALASLTLTRKSGKSAVKECERQGLVIGYTESEPTRPADTDSDTEPDEDEDDSF